MRAIAVTLATIMAALTAQGTVLFQESFDGTTLGTDNFGITANGTYSQSEKFINVDATGNNVSDVVAGLDYGTLQGAGITPSGNSVFDNNPTVQNRFRLDSTGLTLNEGETVYFSAVIDGTKRANFGFFNYTGVPNTNWNEQIAVGLNTQIGNAPFDANAASDFDAVFYEGDYATEQRGTAIDVTDNGSGPRLILGRIINNAGDDNDVIEFHLVRTDSGLSIGSSFPPSDLDGAGGDDDDAQFYSKTDYNFGGNLSLTNFNFALQNNSGIDEIIFATEYTDVFYGDPSALLPPGGLAAEATASEEVTLSWSTIGRNAESYNVYRSLESGSYGAALTNVGPGSLASFVDDTVANNNTYYYQLTSVSNGSESVASAEVSVFAFDENDTTPPAAPVVDVAVYGSRIVLDWPDNAEVDLKEYNVYSSTTPAEGTNGTLIASGWTNSVYRENKVPVGQTNYYTVVALDFNDNAGVSDEVSGVAVAPSSEDEVNVYFIMTNDVIYGFGSINADGNISAEGQGFVTNGVPVATNAAYGTYQGFGIDVGGQVYGITGDGEVVAWTNLDSFVAGAVPTTLSTNAAYSAAESNDVNSVSFDPSTGGFYTIKIQDPNNGDVIRYADLDSLIYNTISNNLIYASNRAGALASFYYSWEDVEGNLNTLEPGANILTITGTGNIEGWQKLDDLLGEATTRTYILNGFAQAQTVAGGFALISKPASAVGELTLDLPTISWDGEVQASYRVQSNPNLAFGEWTTIESVWSVTNETLEVEVSSDESAEFFRVISE